MTPILPNRLDWSSAIGLFLINYGQLDWQLFVFLESRMPAEQFAKIKSEPFHERVARVKKLVSEGDYSPEQKEAFAKFFVRLDPIRQLRNLIAHGHMLLRLREHGQTPVLTLSLPKDLDAVDAPDSQHIDFQQMTAALTELTDLIEEFQRVSGGWQSETFQTHGGQI